MAVLLAGFTPCTAAAQDRALVVAIDRYADPQLSSLPAGLAANDIESVRTLLEEKLGYEPEDIKVLHNEEATKAAILSAAGYWLNAEDPPKDGEQKEDAAADRGRPDATFRSYLYFSGLGYYQPDTDGDEKDGMDETLVPYDAEVNRIGENDRAAGMISDDEFSAALSRAFGRHVTVVLDTSHSGFVTRSRDPGELELSRVRAPGIEGSVRSVSGGERIEAHKSEGPFVDVEVPYGSFTLWSAASPTQTALIAGADAAPQGLFTLLYVEGLAGGEADANANGIVSNAELLRHVSEDSAAYCLAFNERCEMGLRPRLDPASAYGDSAWVDRNRVTRARERELTLTRLTDFLGQDREGTVAIKQVPPSPVRVGTGNIRYEVYGPTTGRVVLLNLTEDGMLFQLYPNQYGPVAENGSGAAQGAGGPLVVPDPDSGVTFSATEPAAGHIVGVVTPDAILFGSAVTDRPIGSVSRGEAIDVYITELTAALHQPVNTHSMQANTRTARWTVNVLPYEVLPAE